VRVNKVAMGKWKEAGIKEGFIIAYVDKIPADNVEDLNRILDFKRGGILIEGFYSEGQKGTYGLEW
jgi:serine protease Do